MNKQEQGFTNLNQDLIDGCIAGDQKSQFLIYRQYYLSMYNTSLMIVKDEAEAEDIMQESFLAAFEKIATYQGKVSFGSWLKRIVVNRSLDALRKKKPELTDILEQETVEEEIIDEEKQEYQIRQIRKAMESLSDGYRLVLSLYLFEGYDHREIAGILNIAESSSRSQYARARIKLQKILKNG